MFKRILIPVIIILVLLGGGYYFANSQKTNKPAAKKTTQDETKNLVTVFLNTENDEPKTSAVLKIKEGSTVLELMQSAKKSGKIDYTSKSSSYGEFIESINGVAGDAVSGKYWTLYVNDQMAQVGVSAQKIKANDVIKWKYQKL